jgi:dienelactone hydrolase
MFLAAMRRWACIGAALLAVLLCVTGRRYVHGLALVVRAADLQGPIRRVADLDTVRIAERIVHARVRDASMRARIYEPVAAASQTLLLVSGLHPAGIDEPRLIALSRRLAESNVTVVTPDIPELSRFEITAALTDRIENAASWLATESRLVPNGRIGLMGVSFSGGLAVVAAGRPSLRDRLLYVFSFGGHDDLRRVLEYFCAGIGAGTRARGWPAHDRATLARPPHDYGVAVVLLNVADQLVPPEQVAPLRDGVRRFLDASYIDRFDSPRAEREFAAVRRLASTLPEPAATLLGYVSTRDVARLGPLLRPCIGLSVDAPALSPARSPAPSVPVFLLHGRDDTVIPAVESRHLAERLRGRVPVHLLMTGLISHAEADRPAEIADVLRLAGFWGDLLAERTHAK